MFIYYTPKHVYLLLWLLGFGLWWCALATPLYRRFEIHGYKNFNTIQQNSKQSHFTRYSMIQYGTIPYNMVQYDMKQYRIITCNSITYETLRDNTIDTAQNNVIALENGTRDNVTFYIKHDAIKYNIVK